MSFRFGILPLPHIHRLRALLLSFRAERGICIFFCFSRTRALAGHVEPLVCHPETAFWGEGSAPSSHGGHFLARSMS